MNSPGLAFPLILQISINPNQSIHNQLQSMLGAFFETLLLFINAIAILNEKRFLKKYGFHTEAAQASVQNETLTSKSKIIMMIFTLRSFGKYFLIVLNILAIFFEVLG